MRQTKRYDVLIVGTTFAGLGLASGKTENAVVIERTGAVGSEFTSAFRNAKVDLGRRESKEAAELRNEAVKRNMIGEEGTVHWPAFVPVLHQWIYRNNLQVRFLTRVIEVTALPNGGFEVLLMDAAGLSKVEADRIVDTTSFCETAPDAAREQLRDQRLHAVIYRPEAPEEQPPLVEGYAVHKGRFASEWVTGCPIGVGCDWATARAQFVSYWSARPEALHPWQLATIADAFDVSVDMRTEEQAPGWLWHPSAAYTDPIAAFESGVQFRWEVTCNDAI